MHIHNRNRNAFATIDTTVWGGRTGRPPGSSSVAVWCWELINEMWGVSVWRLLSGRLFEGPTAFMCVSVCIRVCVWEIGKRGREIEEGGGRPLLVTLEHSAEVSRRPQLQPLMRVLSQLNQHSRAAVWERGLSSLHATSPERERWGAGEDETGNREAWEVNDKNVQRKEKLKTEDLRIRRWAITGVNRCGWEC